MEQIVLLKVNYLENQIMHHQKEVKFIEVCEVSFLRKLFLFYNSNLALDKEGSSLCFASELSFS
jgi:hypothetical protein